MPELVGHGHSQSELIVALLETKERASPVSCLKLSVSEGRQGCLHEDAFHREAVDVRGLATGSAVASPLGGVQPFGTHEANMA